MPTTEEELAREIWLGGLTAKVATVKGLRNVLWLAADTTVSSLPQPVVRVLVRRGYRQDGKWVAYAFVVCRSREEADTWRVALDGKEEVISFDPSSPYEHTFRVIKYHSPNPWGAKGETGVNLLVDGPEPNTCIFYRYSISIFFIN